MEKKSKRGSFSFYLAIVLFGSQGVVSEATMGTVLTCACICRATVDFITPVPGEEAPRNIGVCIRLPAAFMLPSADFL
jgi:hypothetical protein